VDLNDYKTYLAIGIVGLVVGILYLVLQDELAQPLLVFFITIYLIVMLRYLLERRHYKKHKAIIASTQFLLLPFCIILMGNYISSVISSYFDIFTITIDLSGGSSMQMFFNMVSISLILPVIMLTFHFNNYYSRKWPAIAIRRKVKKGKIIPLLIHSAFIFTILLGFFLNWQIDFVGLIFVAIYLFFIFRYFILVRLIKSDRRVVVQRASTTRRTSTTRRKPSSSASGRVTSTRQRSSTQSSQRRRTSTSSRSKPSTLTSRARGSSARISPGIDVSSRKTTKKTTRATKTKTTGRDFFPSGRAHKEEMKCIICFMDFNKKETRKVVLCPHCRYPAHEDEFRSWYASSKLCARCNKSISVSYVRNPKYRITTKIYIERVIDKL
jgi:membrane protein implicated in regulation of membrane protease activity